MNVLISSAGRRVGLLEAFRLAQSNLAVGGQIFAVDTNPLSAAFQSADKAWLVPPCNDSAFIPTMLRICESERVSVLVPTIDTELGPYAAHKKAFDEIGTLVAISALETVDIAADKALTNAFFRRTGVPTVNQYGGTRPDEAAKQLAFPAILKPRRGSSAIGVHEVASGVELTQMWNTVVDPIAEEKAFGEEFTVNVYVDAEGRCVCEVPHMRIEVRAGEVSKGITVKDPTLMQYARAVAEKLPGAFGALCLQCRRDEKSNVRFFEINARFGGGSPLAFRAGALFPSWLLQERMGRPVTRYDDWQDGLVMLRYDAPVFRTTFDIERATSWPPGGVAPRG